MIKTLITLFTVIFTLSNVWSQGLTKKAIKGDWKIHTVVIENDTLFLNDNAKVTSEFYRKKSEGWKKSKEDNKYLSSCMNGTYRELNSARLRFKSKEYSIPPIMPCWDFIKHPGMSSGSYTIEGNFVQLKNVDSAVHMTLNYDTSTKLFTYSNAQFNYQITFSKCNN